MVSSASRCQSLRQRRVVNKTKCPLRLSPGTPEMQILVGSSICVDERGKQAELLISWLYSSQAVHGFSQPAVPEQ